MSTLAALSNASRLLVKNTIAVPLAEKGSPWNAGCVLEPDLLARRFVLFGTAGNQKILVYEHGGFFSHQHAVCFTQRSDGLTMVANLEVQGVERVDDLPKALAVGQYRSVAHY